MTTARGFYRRIKTPYRLNEGRLRDLLAAVDRERVHGLTGSIYTYLESNLHTAIDSRESISDYRLNPYVFMTSASNMDLTGPSELAGFLVNLKLYMGLETSFGKALEAAVMEHYPIARWDGLPYEPWAECPEKVAEFEALDQLGLSREERAQHRSRSVWREIDRACRYGDRRHYLTIKSGPATINDTQVAAMTTAILDHHDSWLKAARDRYADIDGIDIVVGLTYGTPLTTNNKENQILVRLMREGFAEADPVRMPGVLANYNDTVRAYRVVGADYWSYVANPGSPGDSPFAFVEVLLALSAALRDIGGSDTVQNSLNRAIGSLGRAILDLQIPREAFPGWMTREFSDDELSWFVTGLTAFFDPS